MIEGFVKTFKKVEDAFADYIKSLGEVSRSTKEEDINEHWDVKLNVKFDVKAIKKTNRYDEYPNENIHWVELLNVHGRKGWLYGEADYFSFETEDYWLIVSKEKLQEFISVKCKDKIYVSKPELYKLYSRANRQDTITLIKTIDLCYLAEKIFKK
jgi:hypothetical protein